ncbi:MAG: hypothetical protein L6R42_002507 [Xanthoria sp. 1 TBL-2021]|nr:MAG: hypothetical protein L6R42_002507 [Xanthoria sp. 1 TBL-2021]
MIGQAPIVNGKWKEALATYCTTTTSLKRSTSHNRGQTGFIFAIENQEDRVGHLRSQGNANDPGQLQRPSQKLATDRFESTSLHGLGTAKGATSDGTPNQPGAPSRTDSRAGLDGVTIVGTEMNTAQRNGIPKSYRNKAATYQRAVETAIAAQHEMDVLTELLGGARIEESFDQQSMETGQAPGFGSRVF